MAWRRRPSAAAIAALTLTAGLTQRLYAEGLTRAPLRAALAVPFVANEGQWDPAVAFSALSPLGVTFVTHRGEIVHSLPGGSGTGWTVVETLVGGRPQPAVRTPASTRVSYLLGSDPGRWQSNLKTYGSISLGEVWEGITVSLEARRDGVEKIFEVAPGHCASSIRTRVSGAIALRANKDGSLTVATGIGEFRFTPPVAYQFLDGLHAPVDVAYSVTGDEYGFRLGRRDPNRTVFIDPVLQSTYLGGTGPETAYGLAVHPTTGDVYVVGRTSSNNFPGTAGGAQPAAAGFGDAFVARLDATLTRLIQATYVGGSGSDWGRALLIHPTGREVYVAGETGSTDFPGTPGSAQPANAGFDDAFVARLDPSLTSLVRATYLGGSNSESGPAIGLQPVSGHVYVTGQTSSAGFPRTVGGAQPVIAGTSDAFLSRLSADLSVILQSSFFGGGLGETARSVAVTGDAVYIAGSTTSGSLPGTLGGAQTGPGGGGEDGFVARFDLSLTALLRSTYIGGSGGETVYGLAAAPVGDVYAVGFSSSTNLPGTLGAAQPSLAGQADGFVARLSPELTALSRATYLGGSEADSALAVRVHPVTGEPFVAGFSGSINFPGTAGGAQPARNGLFFDAIVARLRPDLTAISQSTYFGGTENDIANALALAPDLSVLYIAGTTGSDDLPRRTGGAQPVFAGASGNFDAFAAGLTVELGGGPAAPIPAVSPAGMVALAALLATAALLLLRGRTGA